MFSTRIRLIILAWLVIYGAIFFSVSLTAGVLYLTFVLCGAGAGQGLWWLHDRGRL